MIRPGMLAVLAGCLMSAVPAQAQFAGHFHWEPGRTLTYRVEHITTVLDEADGTKSKAVTKLNETKRWQVLAVDKAGVGTLQLSLTAMRLELTRTDGESLLFDSSAAEKSNPQMREQLSKYVGVPLAVLRIDPCGKVLEVKQSKFGPASRFESEPPFVIVLPADKPTWERSYQITLEPPQGTGEKFAAVQMYRLIVDPHMPPVINPSCHIELTTAIKDLPAATGDQVPLLQYQPSGQVTFDALHGRLIRADLKIDKELKGHQGEGSSYRLTSTYREELVGN